MELEPVTGIAAATALAPAYVHRAHETASPAQVSLAEAQAVAAESIEQLADDGDPLAIDELAKEHLEQVPIDAHRLQSPYVVHAPGAHEPGKGDVIDIYD